MWAKCRNILESLVTRWRLHVYNQDHIERVQGITTHWSAFVAFCGLILFYYMYKISLSPGYHGDEESLLYIPWRFVEFSDLSYPLFFGDTVNTGEMRQYPPAMAFMLRNILHVFVGFGAEIGRVFSALMIFIPTVLMAVLLRRERDDKTWYVAVCCLAVLALHPNMVLAARSIRFEQEVLFMGSMAFLLPLLCTSENKKLRNMLIWGLAGLCAAWASTSHVWGIVMGATLGASLIFLAPIWKIRDGMSWWGRITCVVIGGAPPLAIAMYQLFSDVEQTQLYLDTIKGFYEIREQQLVSAFFRMYFLPDVKGGIGVFFANILELHTYGYAPGSFGRSGIHVVPFGVIYKIIFWCCLGHVFLSVPYLWKNRHDEKHLFPLLFSALAIFYVIFLFFYTPNKTYFLYVSYFVIGASFILSCYGVKQRFYKEIHALMVALSVVFMVCYSAYLLVFVSDRQVNLDEKQQTLIELRESLNIDNSLRSYCGNASWAGCGKNAGTWRDLMLKEEMDEEITKRLGLIVIDPSLLGHFMTFFMMPENTEDKKQAQKIRLDNWQSLSEKISLSGGYINAQNNRAFLFFQPKDQKSKENVFAIFERKTGLKTWWSQGMDIDRNVDWVTAGRYIILARDGKNVIHQWAGQDKRDNVEIVYQNNGKYISDVFVVFDVLAPMSVDMTKIQQHRMKKMRQIKR